MPQPLEASCFSGNSIQSIIKSSLYATTFFFFSIKEQPLSDFFGLPGQIAYPQPAARDWQSWFRDLMVYWHWACCYSNEVWEHREANIVYQNNDRFSLEKKDPWSTKFGKQ